MSSLVLGIGGLEMRARRYDAIGMVYEAEITRKEAKAAKDAVDMAYAAIESSLGDS